jgi:deoxyribonuclease V
LKTVVEDSFLWPREPAEARALQERLASRVIEKDPSGPVRFVAGVDVHYSASAGLAWAAIAVLEIETLELVESVQLCRAIDFPYITGLLSFREAPAALAAIALLSRPPDLLMVDGQGLAHPRRFGLASHIGCLADLPAIGVAKSRLVGRHEEPPASRGSFVPLEHRGEMIGAVLRSQDRMRPLYVSVGHRITLQTALTLTMACTTRYRMPEPTRIADRLSRAHG